MDHPADWLGDADRVAELGRRLIGAGVPADRVALFRRTLHPAILGRATAWSAERPVEIYDREHGLDLSLGFAGSPLDHAIADGADCSLTGAEIDRSGGGWTEALRSLGLSFIRLVPLPRGAALAIGTRCRAGFSDGDEKLIRRFAAPLAKGAKRQKPISQ